MHIDLIHTVLHVSGILYSSLVLPNITGALLAVAALILIAFA